MGKKEDKKKPAVTKLGCVFPMVIVTILLHAEFGSNNHRIDASLFIIDLQIVAYNNKLKTNPSPLSMFDSSSCPKSPKIISF